MLYIYFGVAPPSSFKHIKIPSVGWGASTVRQGAVVKLYMHEQADRTNRERNRRVVADSGSNDLRFVRGHCKNNAACKSCVVHENRQAQRLDAASKPN